MTCSFRMRMQPCETARPISSGRLVPWMPTTPPPGQSVMRAYALVSRANGP